MMRTIEVDIPGRSYPIMIEHGLVEGAGEIVKAVANHDRLLLATDAAVTETHGRKLQSSLEAAGYAVTMISLVAEERRKTLSTVKELYERMLAARLDRGSPMIALGGGIVGDTAGYAAATFLRGVPLVQVPTTLLAMVDASIGGKTGVNFPLPSKTGERRQLGKNLIGAFWQPRAIIIDPEVLRTLSARHFRCGLAECIKHGVLADEGLVRFIEENVQAILAQKASALKELIERSASIKARIVAADEREEATRALLNLGHTFAHAIEAMESLDLEHGEAVAIGMCAAARCSVETGRMSEEEAERLKRLIAEVGLPTHVDGQGSGGGSAPFDRLIDAMGYDKKVAGGRIRLVLPRGLGAAEVVSEVSEELLGCGWREVGVRR